MRNLFAILLLLLIFSSIAYANDNGCSLSGIKNIQVQVDTSQVENDIHLDQNQLETQIEQRLKKSDVNLGSGPANFVVSIDIISSQDHLTSSFSVDAILLEPAKLSRLNVNPVTVITWAIGCDGLCRRDEIINQISSAVKGVTDDFTKDYSADNKQLISPTKLSPTLPIPPPTPTPAASQ